MTISSRPAPPPDILELNTGDRMTREEFHRAYEKTHPGLRAELIGGIVYVSSPLTLPHGSHHFGISGAFFNYVAATPGVQSADNTTILLGAESEPQPDLLLRILPEYGGQSKTSGRYISGAPELIAEIALSSRSIDLHAKRRDYAQYGVREYLVVCVREQQIRWFNLPHERENRPDADGILRVETFPGLWLDGGALFSEDYSKLVKTVQQGLASPEHAAFVAHLASVHSAGKAKRK